MRSEPWNEETAREALTLLRQAHDAWTALLPTALAPDQDSDPVHVSTDAACWCAVRDVWVRGLDDMADGSDGLPGYPVARAAQADSVDAAVYACNQAIHQLIHVWRFDQGARPSPRRYPLVYAPASLRWVSADRLPPEVSDTGIAGRRRTAYLARWAGQPMADGLAEIRAFMDAESGPDVGL